MMTPTAVAESQLERLLPHFDFVDRHHLFVPASPAQVYGAVAAVTLAEMPLVRLLLELRAIPHRLAGRSAPMRRVDQPLISQMLQSGFVVLAEEPGHELVIGMVGQMWKPAGGRRARIHDAGEFIAWQTPGFAKAAMNFRVVASADGTLLSTETRIVATDILSRLAFGAYWCAIRRGSGAIRSMWLRAIARRARSLTGEARRG
jgi:hypothetical protein